MGSLGKRIRYFLNKFKPYKREYASLDWYMESQTGPGLKYKIHYAVATVLDALSSPGILLATKEEREKILKEDYKDPILFPKSKAGEARFKEPTE